MDILEKLKQPITGISSELFRPKTDTEPELFQPAKIEPKKMESPIQTAKAAGGLVLDLIRAPIRAVVSATGVVDVSGKAEITPKTKAERLIFGKEPIPSFQKREADIEKKLVEGGRSPTFAKLMSFPAVAGLTVADAFLGGGGTSRKIITDLVKEGTEVGARNILKQSTKLAPEVIDDVAPRLASATTEKEVKSILDEAVKAPRVPTKVFRAGTIDTANPGGIFMSKDRKSASLYEFLEGGRKTEEYTLSPSAKIKTATTREELLKELDPRFNDISLNERFYAEERKAIREKKAGLRKSSLIDGMTPRQRFETEIEKRIANRLKGKYDGVLYESGGKNDQVGEYQIFNKDIIKTASETTTTPTVDTTQPPLLQEARKYKSAEEFVNSQPKLYHGTSEVIKGEFNYPLYLTDNPKYADVYRSKSASSINPYKKGGGEKVYEFVKTTPKNRVLDVRNPNHLELLDEYFANESLSGAFYPSEKGLVDWTEAEGIADFVKKHKLPFDAMLIDEGGIPMSNWKEIQDRGIGYVALNKNAIKTKSQLTDIWNKANAPSTRLQKQAGVQGAESKSLFEVQGTKLRIGAEIPPTEGKLKAQKQVLADVADDQTLTTQYPKDVEKAIVRTAQQTGDSPKLTSRVLNSLKEAKTKVIEYVQNEQERVRKLVARPDVKTTDVSDPYLKATLFSGRVNNKIEGVKKEVGEIFKDIKSSGITRKDVSDYLYFRHTPERNLAIGERASGITTEEAKAGLKTLESSPKGKEIKRIADKVQDINNRTLVVLKESGVITDDLYKTLTTKYKNHVPLQRIMEETEDIGTVLSGKGFDVRSTGIKGAKGSERKVEDIMTNVLTNYEQAILRSEKNIVDNATLKFVRDNKVALGDSMVIKKPKAVGETFEGKPILENTQDPRILQMFEDGKRVWIEIKDPELAIALRGIGKEKLPGILRGVGAYTRFYSGLATRFYPEFALPNKIRDLQETMVYLASQKDVGFKGAAKTALGDPSSTKSVLDYLRGADTPGARLYAEMREAGGTTGGFGLSTKKQVELNLEKLEKLANSKTRRIADNIVEYVDNWNTIFEDSTRLSVYKQAVNSGLSVERAAFLAKEASINFNRMGRGGPLINSLYMFSNASIQGSMKMLRAMKNPKVAMAVTTAVGSSVAAVSEWNDKVDPDWRNKVSKWDRLNNLTIVIPSSDGEFRVAKVPVSWGIKPIKVMADYAYDTVSGEDLDPKKALGDILIATIEAYNPAGGSDLLSAISPTILDVPFELGRNKSWSGNKIKPDYDPNAPEDVRYFQSLGETKTGQAAISISEMLYDKLNIAISPADMKYAYEQYVGGAGRTITKTANLLGSFADEESLPLDEYPMLSRFYSERTAEEVGSGAGGRVEEIKGTLEKQSRERFKMNKKAEKLDEELSQMPRAEANRELLKIRREDKPLYEQVKEAKESRELGLSYEERLIRQLGVANNERANYIHKQITNLATSKERNAYYLDLKKKKIISNEVAEQLKKLKIGR